MNEFDKELDKIQEDFYWSAFQDGQAAIEGGAYDPDARPISIVAIKQAVDKYVIGKPINIHGRANLYASKPGTEGLEQKWYDQGTNGRIEEQRRALNGDSL